MTKSRLLIAAALLFAVCVFAHAQQPEARRGTISLVRLGNVIILVPDPEGYEEVTTRCPAFRRRMEATEAPQNDMLLAHLPQSICESLSKGENVMLDNYTKVSVLRDGREILVSRETLAATVEGFRQNFDTLADPDSARMKAMQKNSEQKLSELDSRETKIDMTKPQYLGEFNAGSDVHGFLTLVSLTIKSGAIERAVRVLVSTSLVRVKQRMIFVYTFSEYHSDADLSMAKQFATKWTDSIMAANRHGNR